MNLEKERDTKISELWTYGDWVDEINRISLQDKPDIETLKSMLVSATYIIYKEMVEIK